MKIIKNVLYTLGFIALFLLVTLPSIIYGIVPYLLIPLTWVMRLLLHKPAFTYTSGILALRLSTIVLIVIIPSLCYLYVNEVLGWIIFAWMALYLLIRIYSGVHEKEKVAINAAKKLGTLTKNANSKDNTVIAFITIILNLVALTCGYYLGKEQGLWIGVLISAIIWCLSPFANKK